MTSMGRQQEVISAPGVMERIKTPVENMATPICNCCYVPGTSSTANRAETSHQVEEANFARTIEEPIRIKNIHSQSTH